MFFVVQVILALTLQAILKIYFNEKIFHIRLFIFHKVCVS